MGTLRLPVTLTDADRLTIAAEMSAAQTALEAVEAEKKAATREFNESIKAKKATIHDRNGILRAGVIHRDVEVETRDDPETGKRVTWRLDTMTTVHASDLDPDERQVLMDLPPPGSTPVGDTSNATDEQREASTPEEAEALRAERLANERAERISAGVQEARERITVLSEGEGDTAWKATLQYGNRVLEAEAATAEAAANGVIAQVTEILEAQEDEAANRAAWADAAAASEAEQKRQEVERLAAEQADDDKQTKKRTVKVGAGDGLKNGGLKAPKRVKRTRHPVELPDGRVVDPEEEAAKLDAAEAQTPEVDPEGEVLVNESVPVDADGKPLAF